VDRGDLGNRVSDAEHAGTTGQGRQRAVKEAATVAEAVTGPVEGDDRGQNDIRLDFAAGPFLRQ